MCDIGLLGVIRLAKADRVIEAAGPLVGQLRAAGDFIGDNLVAEVLRALGEPDHSAIARR